MPHCPVCARSVATLDPRCPLCGARPSDSVAATLTTAGGDADSQTSMLGASLAPHLPRAFGGGDFAPGHLLAGRYRIVAPLGRGGMGEVYRADDLELGQTVALKLLPASVAGDPDALARLKREVRTARQVSHPNVCRVFDIGEAEGRRFLTMEYIDGEDLASLLRRIGRCPNDKALEIARQLCAGLAAAHAAGVLHRDLKPGNVMIDGRGHARITDFGLSGLVEELRHEEGLAGTPGYMAPEQLDGRPASQKSDIYALGLVLYELWSGRRPFSAPDLQTLRLRQREASAPSLGSLVPDAPPAVERAIERCLEPDPGRRPASALHVAAALPGSDPLAAALARGETPSPDLVAAAPTEGTLGPRTALSLLTAFFVLLAVVIALSYQLRPVFRLPLERPPEVLADRARELLRELVRASPADWEGGFADSPGAWNFLADNTATGSWKRLESGQPAVLRYWYRQSPRPIAPPGATRAGVRTAPLREPGEALVELDVRGRLLRLLVVPWRGDGAAGTPDFTLLLSRAGLDASRLTPAAPRLVPEVPVDVRQAWSGPHPDHPDLTIHVEAGAFVGEPVFFELRGPWDDPREQPESRQNLATGVFTAVIALVAATGLLVAWLNLAAGRGDRRGAFRLAVAGFAGALLGELLSIHFAPSRTGVVDAIWEASRTGSGVAVLLAVAYLAIEPHIRRRLPRLLISWSRLLAGDPRDPLVGRDVLVGALGGIAHTGFICGASWVDTLTQPASKAALPVEPTMLEGPLRAVGALASMVTTSLLFSLVHMLLVLLLLLLLRRERPVTIAYFLVLLSIELLFFGRSPAHATGNVLIAALLTLVVLRFGLLSAAIAQVTFITTFVAPHTPQLSAWFFASGAIGPAVVALLAVWGFHTSLGGQKLFQPDEESA